jgi:hypothetical protein
MSEWAWKMQQIPRSFCTFCEDILCGRYVIYEMIYTVLTLNVFELVAVYARDLRHSLIPEICYPDGGLS